MQDAMKKVFLLTFLLSFTFTVKAQSFLSLDSCRALALANNKDLLISNEKISAAHYQRKAAFTNYLPNFSATGAYMRNQKEFSLLNNDQKAALSGLGTKLAGPIQQAATEIATAHPDLAPLISSLSGKLGAVLPALDQAGNSLVTCFHSSPCVCHFRLLPNGIPTSLQIIVHFHKCSIITFGTGEFFLRTDKLSSHSLHSLLVKLRDTLFDFVVFSL